MDKIKLNFINKSNDVNNSSIVIFQKNVASDFDEIAVAWKVIQNCGEGDNHPLDYNMNFEVGASDSYGNYTPQMQSEPGDSFQMIKSTSGDVLEKSSTPAASSKEVEIKNYLQQGSINAYCYRNGTVCALKTGLSPAQKAVFEFKPTLWIGVVSQITEGDVMNSAILSEINTEINLFGIESADIVMTGGGAGANAKAFSFNIENIVTA